MGSGAIARTASPEDPPPPPRQPRPPADPKEAVARAIERLRRLWAVARGTSGPEADNARAIAEKYERSSGIALRIIETTPIPATVPPPPVIRIMGAGGLAMLEWEGLLIEGVANLFGVLVVRELDEIALVGERERVVDTQHTILDLLADLRSAYARRCPDEHRGRDGVVPITRWNGARVYLDVQGWRWEFSIAWTYAVLIELIKKFPRNVDRPVDIAHERSEAAIGGRAVTSDETSTRMPVMQQDARNAGTSEGMHTTGALALAIQRLERFHGAARYDGPVRW